jgi:hypothetical protein
MDAVLRVVEGVGLGTAVALCRKKNREDAVAIYYVVLLVYV